jgi:hypothetical protein
MVQIIQLIYAKVISEDDSMSFLGNHHACDFIVSITTSPSVREIDRGGQWSTPSVTRGVTVCRILRVTTPSHMTRFVAPMEF